MEHSPFECEVEVNGRPVGILTRLPHASTKFTYHPEYIAQGGRSISPHLLTKDPPKIYEGLPPFFSNLVSEGWLRLQHQITIGAIDHSESDAIRSPFLGFDILAFLGPSALRGGSIKPRQRFSDEFWAQLKTLTKRIVAGRTILPGVQPKLFVKEHNGSFVACDPEQATHIAKGEFDSTDENANMKHITGNEYATILAAKVLTPDDQTVDAQMGEVKELGPCIIIKRFDLAQDGHAHRMLDFGQLLDIPPERRNDSTYSAIAQFIEAHADDPPSSHYKTDRRDIMVFAERLCRDILLGNYDTHLKNFSLMEMNGEWRLTPDYDLVHSRFYRDCTLALHVEMPKSVSCTGSTSHAINEREKYLPSISSLRGGKRLCLLLSSLGLDYDKQTEMISNLIARIPEATTVIQSCSLVDEKIKESIIHNMDARRRETFEAAIRWIKMKSGKADPSRADPQWKSGETGPARADPQKQKLHPAAAPA